FSSRRFRRCRRPRGRCRSALIAEIAACLDDRLNPLKGIVPADLAHGHERAEAVKQVLPEHIARYLRLQPTDRAHGTAISRWHAGTGDLAKGNLGGRLQRDDHEIPLLDSIAKLVQLRGEVQLSLRFTRHLLLKVAFARTWGEPWPGPGRLSL